MSEDTVFFLLGEKFRWSLLGDDDGEENDEDSVINDLDYYLSNYEAPWDGASYKTPFEHWGWEQLRKVLRVQRASSTLRREVAGELEENPGFITVPLPMDTELASSVWIVKAQMRKQY